MRWVLFLVFAMTSAVAVAADKVDSVKNGLGVIALDSDFSLTFFSKDTPDDFRLYYRIEWKTGKSRNTLRPANGIPTGEDYVYYWDDSKKVLWIADKEVIHSYDLSNALKSNSTSSATHSLESALASKGGVPPAMRERVERLRARK